jgi:hypothetical protein
VWAWINVGRPTPVSSAAIYQSRALRLLVASEPALPNHFGDEQQIGSDLLLAQNVLIGRYFNVVNNKRSNKKCRIHKILITSILQMLTIALLRRLLWVRAPPNPVSFALFSGLGLHTLRFMWPLLHRVYAKP